MKLNPSDTKKLIKKLTDLRIETIVARAYLGGLQPGTGQDFKFAELAIAHVLIKKKPKQFGWAPPPTQGTGSVFVIGGKGIILTGPTGKHVIRLSKFLPMPVAQITVTDAFAFTRGNEGSFEHMYADSEGNATVGIGHAIFQPQEAHKLPFIRKGTGAVATQAEIDKDYNATVGIKGHKAIYFASLTDLELSQTDIDGLFQSDFNKHIKIADAFFPPHQLPQPVQIALFDLAFQTGGKLVKGKTFKRLQDALRRRDWGRAGAEMNVANDATRNNARLTEASKAAMPSSFFTTDPAKTEPLLKQLLKP